MVNLIGCSVVLTFLLVGVFNAGESMGTDTCFFSRFADDFVIVEVFPFGSMDSIGGRS